MSAKQLAIAALLAGSVASARAAPVTAADAPTGTPTTRPTVGIAPTPTVAPAASSAEKPGRDPFRPFNLALRPRPVETPRTPLEQYDVGALKLVPGTRDPEAFDLVRGGAQARGVHEDYRHAADIERLTQRVARRAGNGRDDRALFARQAVHKTRLAHVGPPGQNHLNAAA